MLDNLTLEIEISIPRRVMQHTNVQFEWKDILFVPDYKKEGGYCGYIGNWNNLQLKIFQDKLVIRNSWHKFNKGNNYSDYSIKDIENTLFALEDKFGIQIWDAKIYKIAYGCVINEDPYLNFPNWKYLITKEQTPMIAKGGKKYGACFYFGDYKFKGYDKTYEVKIHDGLKIPDNLFRIECEVKYMRHLTKRRIPILITKAKDLCDPEKMQYLAEDLFEKYNKIEKDSVMILKGKSIHELNIIASMSTPLIRKELRKEHNKTYKRYKKAYDDFNVLGDEYYDKVGQKLISKCAELINS